MLVKIEVSIQQHTEFRISDNHNPPFRFKHIIVEVDTIQFRLPHPIQRAGIIVLKDLFFAVDGINQIHNPVGGVFHGGGNGGQCEVCFSAACWCFDDIQFVL